MNCSVTILSPGVFTLPVDGGRPRTRSLGVPVGGPADRVSFVLGNLLVGNAPNACALELTLAGPTLSADAPLACVVFGAPFDLSTDRRPLRVGTTFTLEPGEVLRVGGTAAGARAYLCVRGGLDAPEVLGSRTGLRPLRAGDVIGATTGRMGGRGIDPTPQPPPRNGEGESQEHRLRGREARAALVGPSESVEPFRPHPRRRHSCDSPSPFRGGGWGVGSSMLLRLPLSVSGRGLGGGVLRLLPAAHSDWFPPLAVHLRVSTAADRMGARLVGPPLPVPARELVSEPVCPGTIQVTRDGQCIILGVDGQTIGGYPKIAQVIAADLPRLGQFRPNDEVSFAYVSIEEAELALCEQAGMLRRWAARLAAS